MKSLKWTSGPDLPKTGVYGVSVPYKNTFLIVGGIFESSSKSIYQFDPNSEGWIRRSEGLQTDKRAMAAFLVPDSAVNCN